MHEVLAAFRAGSHGFVDVGAQQVDGTAAVGLAVRREHPGWLAHQLLAVRGPEQAQGRRVAVDVLVALEQGRGIGFISALAWPGALRMLDRKSPGYDA